MKARSPIPEPTPAQTVTDLVLAMFRLNNAMLLWGDRLVRPFGLTSARWQVMGAIAYADQPQSVAWLARDLGANRQNVQRIVNDLEREGMVRFAPNPRHKRAQLVIFTAEGGLAYRDALELWYRAAAELASGLSTEDLAVCGGVIGTLRRRLAAQGVEQTG